MTIGSWPSRALVVVALVLGACGGGASGLPAPSATAAASPSASPPPGQRYELAPIEDVSVVMRPTVPAQYSVQIRVGLPSGCAKPGGYDVARLPSEIRITVRNLVPADPTVICTMIYGTHTYAVDLPQLAPGTYTLRVNDRATTLTVS